MCNAFARFEYPPIAISKFYPDPCIGVSDDQTTRADGALLPVQPHVADAPTSPVTMSSMQVGALRDSRLPSPSVIRRLYSRFNSLPEPSWDGVGPIRLDLRRRRAKDELLKKHG